jgi:hypothetical protein
MSSDATAVAADASRRAYATNTPAAHKHAANLHQQAASAALGRNDPSSAKKHLATADKHKLKAHELGKQESAPKKGAKQNTPDEPDDDGKVENPLTTWARS